LKTVVLPEPASPTMAICIRRLSVAGGLRSDRAGLSQ
jgi:hypothetical protein